MAVNGAGNEVFVTDGSNDSVIEVSSGHESTVASGLHFPDGVAVDAAGDLFIAEAGTSDVVKVAPGVQTTVGSDLSLPEGLAVDAQGDVFIADSGTSRVVKVTPTGFQITVGSGLSDPEAVAVDAAGDVFIADTDNNRAVEVPVGVPVTVNQDPTSTDVAAGSASVTFGQSETFMATISVPSGSTAPSSGTVEFKDGTSVIGTAPVTAGVATFTTSALAGGLAQYHRTFQRCDRLRSQPLRGRAHQHPVHLAHHRPIPADWRGRGRHGRCVCRRFPARSAG